MTAWESTVAQLERTATLHQYSTMLPPRQAEALQLTDAGHTPQQLAEHFGITVEGAQDLVKRAQRRHRATVLAKQGLTARQIAARMGLNLNVIARIIPRTA